MAKAETPGKRIMAARMNAGVSRAFVARELRLALMSYKDLESYEETLFVDLSLAQTRSLCELLKTRLAVILDEPALACRHRVDFSEIAAMISAYLDTTGSTFATFEANVGWQVRLALCDPRWVGNWNLAEFRVVCSRMGVDWRNFPPA